MGVNCDGQWLMREAAETKSRKHISDVIAGGCRPIGKHDAALLAILNVDPRDEYESRERLRLCGRDLAGARADSVVVSEYVSLVC